MPEQKRTQFAMQALGLAELFHLQVGAERLGGAVAFHVELAAPEGPSTGGGKQSMQHLKLVPEGGGPVTVAGWADPVARTAELRTYEHVSGLHAQRFKGQPIPLDRAQYDRLFGRMHDFFTQNGLQVTIAAVPAPVTAAVQQQPASSSNLGLILALLFVVAVVVGAGVFFLLRLRQ